MHSFGYRLNTLLTLAAFLFALLCSLASVSHNFNVPSVIAHAEVLKVNRFRKQLSGNDELHRLSTENGSYGIQWSNVSLTLNISMDVQSTFTWNTKQVFVFVAAEYQTAQNSLNQVSLWDHIIQDKDQANLQTQIVTKYPLIDQGSNLRGTKIKLVLHWYIMPKTGGIIEDKMVISDFYLPQAYI